MNKFFLIPLVSHVFLVGCGQETRRQPAQESPVASVPENGWDRNLRNLRCWPDILAQNR